MPKKKGLPAARLSANAFIGVSDIRGYILYTRDGTQYAYLKIHPFSVDLLSDREKAAFVRALTAEFSSERKPFKFFCISRPVEITAIMGELTAMLGYATDAVHKDLLMEEMGAIHRFAVSGEVIERQFYIVLWEPAGEDAERELMKRAGELCTKLDRCGVRADPAPQDAIVQLCNLFANPAYAHMEGVDVDPSIPMLDGGAVL